MTTPDLRTIAMQKGSAPMMILALLDESPRHGYEIVSLIADRSGGRLQIEVPSVYPLLYRLEADSLVAGRWVEKPGQRRRRFYSITAKGRTALRSHRQRWREFVEALDQVAGFSHA